MENPLSDLTKQLKESAQKYLPDATTFTEFIKPFFLHEQENYEKYLKILEKIGVKNGVKGLIEIINGTANAELKKTDNVIHEVNAKLENKYKNKAVPPTKQGFIEDTQELRSFEGTMPYMKEMLASGYSHEQKQKSNIDKNARELSEDERKIYDYFFLLITKLYVNYVISNFSNDNLFIKEFLLDYFKSMNSLYNKEKVPYNLITYIENLKLPESTIPENENIEANEGYTPKTSVPVFHQIEDIYKILQKYFDKIQHEMLRSALQTGINKKKLAFKGKQIQLADVFKRLHKANLITGSNKDELIKWITNMFTYRGQKGKYLPFKEKYLNHIISTDTKPCKNPIIEIKKDEEGKTIISSPDQKDRKEE